MIGARVLVATLALWVVGGFTFEAKQYADRAVSRAVAGATTAKTDGQSAGSRMTARAALAAVPV